MRSPDPYIPTTSVGQGLLLTQYSYNSLWGQVFGQNLTKEIIGSVQSTQNVVLAGTNSQVTGGKFANGAESGAFVHLYNSEGGTFSRIWKGLTSSMSTLNDRKGEILNTTGKGFNGLAKGVSEISFSQVGSDIVDGIAGGAKGLHQLMTMDASKVGGGKVGEGLFSMLTLKIGAGSGSHVGYEVVSSEMLWTTRLYGFSNPLTGDTIYTVGNGEMYSVNGE